MFSKTTIRWITLVMAVIFLLSSIGITGIVFFRF